MLVLNLMIRKRLIIVVSACLVFAVNNTLLDGYMTSYQSLGSEIAAPADALYEWHLNEKAPFEYRMLFPTIVLSAWKVAGGGNTAFFWCYLTVSLLCLIASSLAFFQLLVELNFSRSLSLLGVIIFLLLPPLLLAYTLPVHTREDTLAYFLLCLGLIFLFRKQYFWFFFTCLISVFCRETLLILPFTFLFFSRDFSFLKRVIGASFPVIIWLALRIMLETNKSAYDPLEGFKWNLANPEQVLVFTFIAFGPFWILWLRGRNLILNKKACDYDNEGIKMLAKSAPWALALILITTFLGGIYNEIRLLYLGFPWVLGLSLIYIKTYQNKLRSAIYLKSYVTSVTVLVMITGVGGYFIVLKQDTYLAMTQHNIPGLIWPTVGLIMSSITVALLLLFFTVFRQRTFSPDFHE